MPAAAIPVTPAGAALRRPPNATRVRRPRVGRLKSATAPGRQHLLRITHGIWNYLDAMSLQPRPCLKVDAGTEEQLHIALHQSPAPTKRVPVVSRYALRILKATVRIKDEKLDPGKAGRHAAMTRCKCHFHNCVK